MSSREIAVRMPKPQRDLLIAHVDGPQPLTISHESMVRNALLARDLLRFDNRASLRPKSTHLTDLGREVLCAILGDYADALVRCGALETIPTIVLRLAPKIAPETIVAVDQEKALADGWRSGLTAS